MNRIKSRFFLLVVLATLSAACMCTGNASAQNQNAILTGPGWQVMRADWGAGNRWMDVTYRVCMVLSGNGMVRVTNGNLGGDPAVGRDKVLTVIYRLNGREQISTVKEGGILNVP